MLLINITKLGLVNFGLSDDGSSDYQFNASSSSLNGGYGELHHASSSSSQQQQQQDRQNLETMYAVYRIFLPLVGVVGLLGNAANMAVFSLRFRRQPHLLPAERCAMLGFVGLAVSDLCFCLTIVPHYWHYAPMAAFSTRSFHLYYRLYHHYFVDVFVKTSCWLATVVSVSRYMTVCQPQRAAIFANPRNLKIAIVCSFVTWLCLMLPRLWTYEVIELPKSLSSATTGSSSTSGTLTSPPQVVYVITLGMFMRNRAFKLTFTYIWLIIGYCLPVLVLVFCNTRLVQILARSQSFWKHGQSTAGASLVREGRGQQQEQQRERRRKAAAASSGSGGDGGHRQLHNCSISALLVLLVTMFLVLVSPAELLHAYADLVQPDTMMTYEVAVVISNLLEAFNFALHFALYGLFSRPYRRAIADMAGAVSTYCCSIGDALATASDVTSSSARRRRQAAALSQPVPKVMSYRRPNNNLHPNNAMQVVVYHSNSNSSRQAWDRLGGGSSSSSSTTTRPTGHAPRSEAPPLVSR